MHLTLSLLAALALSTGARAASFTNVLASTGQLGGFDGFPSFALSNRVVLNFGTVAYLNAQVYPPWVINSNFVSTASPTAVASAVAIQTNGLTEVNCSAILGSRLYLAGKAYNLTNACVQEFTMDAFPPTSLTLLSEHQVGNGQVGNELVDQAIVTPAGGVFFFMHRNPDNYPGQLAGETFDVLYRNPSGVWLSNKWVMPGNSTTPNVQTTVAIHPADNTTWFFMDSDASANIQCWRFAEATGSYSATYTNAALIRSTLAGVPPYGPELENAWIVAQPDPANNSIKIAYQRNNARLFQSTPTFWKGAGICIADIPRPETSTTLTYTYFDDWWQERISPFGFAVNGAAWSLLLHPMVTNSPLTWANVSLATREGGVWTTNRVDVGSGFVSNSLTNGMLLYCNLVGGNYATQVLFPTTPPVITVTAPTNGVSATNLVWTFTGTAIDPVDGDISAGMGWWFSNTGGATQCAACNFGSGASFSVGLAPGYWTGQAKATNSAGVIATNTFNFTILSQPGLSAPCVSIQSPVPAQVFLTNTAVPFLASITYAGGFCTNCCASSPDVDAQTRWYSSVDGFLGSGTALSRPLSAGSHTISAVGTDNHVPPQSSTSTVPVVVVTSLPAQQLALALSVGKLYCVRKSTNTITATVTSGGVAVAGATVQAKVTYRYGGGSRTDTLAATTTDGSGQATWSYIVHNEKAGIDYVTGTAAKASYASGTGGTSFMVTLH